jgi:hypothetical protein
MNPAADTTIIRLTRTLKLSDAASIKTENNAQITVEGKDNTTRSLTFAGRGYYKSPGLNLVIGNEYRLRIRTTDGKEYLSEYVKARQTPAIDSISWDRDNDGVRIYANTHDPSRKSIYYRWDYDETWEIHSKYLSYYIFNPVTGMVRQRTVPDELVYTCWRYDTASTIPLANSANLTEDIIYKAPLLHIPFGSDRLSVRYSIQVRQYALDKDAYDFFELMKKNTEQIGSFFSPQPSELRGNIHCSTDPKEYVLGYITASTVDTKRIFIQTAWQFDLTCDDVEVVNTREEMFKYFAQGDYIPYSFNMIDNIWLASSARCVDCRIRGGRLARPSFW